MLFLLEISLEIKVYVRFCNKKQVVFDTTVTKWEVNNMITLYLVFHGECEKALGFYQDVFNCEIKMKQTYGDYVPDGLKEPPENLRDWILHAEMPICNASIWFADEASEPVKAGNNVRITATVPTKKEAERIFQKLSKDAIKITLPPTKTYYSAFHAGVVDKFNVNWNIVAEEADQ